MSSRFTNRLALKRVLIEPLCRACYLSPQQPSDETAIQVADGGFLYRYRPLYLERDAPAVCATATRLP